MVESQNLRNFFRDQYNMIVDLNISINNMMRLKRDEYEYEKQIKGHGYFNHHWYQLKFIATIQLSKFFNNTRNEKRGFHKLFNYLESTPYSDEFLELLASNRGAHMVKSKKEIVEMVNDLRNSIENKKDLIKKVINLRDKAYAHKDPNVTLTNVALNEIQELVCFAGELYNSLNIAVFKTETRFDYTDDWNIDFVLFHMNESRIRNQEEYLRKIDKFKDRRQKN